MKERYQDKGFAVIGIHTPEFDYEKERSRVEAATKRFKLDHPIMMDNDYSYWNALNNRYWPSFYLVSPEGEIVMSSSGEMHEGQSTASKFEAAIKRMLAIR